MSVLLLSLIIVATLLVIFSGVWVTIALIGAVRRVDRRVEGVPPSNRGQDARDTTQDTP